MLLDRIKSSSVEFMLNPEYEEFNELAWSAQRAAKKGYLADVPDVLYHNDAELQKSAVFFENPMQPSVDSSAFL
uniref:Uncharacterized protein n=1 Tax=Peronospora matthiolae TaxID=2874970 RepID=A0AAV1UAT4_9STRA